MNTAKNHRYQETEDAIMDAFLSLLSRQEPEKITVRQVCEACGINRSSFYLHFADVVDLMVRIDQRYAEGLRDVFDITGHHLMPGERWNIGDRFVRFFRFVRDHRTFYREYLRRCPASHLLNITLPEDVTERMEALARRKGISPGSELHYHSTFFRAGVAAMMEEWISRDCPESPEQMGAILVQEYSAYVPEEDGDT